MLIGVVSDSHGDKRMLDKAFNFFKEKGIKHVFHLGDCISDVDFYDRGYGVKIYGVSGNMDTDSMEKSNKVVELDGVKFFLCHGHNLRVNASHDELIKKAKENECQVALYGHTHIPFNNHEDGILVVNPGSLSQPRGNSKKSLAIISTSDNIINAEIYLI